MFRVLFFALKSPENERRVWWTKGGVGEKEFREALLHFWWGKSDFNSPTRAKQSVATWFTLFNHHYWII